MLIPCRASQPVTWLMVPGRSSASTSSVSNSPAEVDAIAVHFGDLHQPAADGAASDLHRALAVADRQACRVGVGVLAQVDFLEGEAQPGLWPGLEAAAQVRIVRGHAQQAGHDAAVGAVALAGSARRSRVARWWLPWAACPGWRVRDLSQPHCAGRVRGGGANHDRPTTSKAEMLRDMGEGVGVLECQVSSVGVSGIKCRAGRQERLCNLTLDT